MNFHQVKYIEGERIIVGDLILDESRLYISSPGISSSTYIPLDKIIFLKKRINGIEVRAKLSAINSLQVKIMLARSARNTLISELVSRLKMKKKFFKAEWTSEAGWR
jgi:hypothetical protein